MGYIYKITNLVNDKIYIGQTSRSIEIRWREHIRHAQTLSHKYPLYKAIIKYGKESFSICQLEECDNFLLNDREIYWIKKLSSFGDNGYNCTTGGQGSTIQENADLDYQEIKSRYALGEGLEQLSKEYCHDYMSIRHKLEQDGVIIRTHAGPEKMSKSIQQIDPITLEIINIFPSISAAARAICPEGRSARAIGNHISRYKNTKTISHGFLWKIND